MVIHANVIVKIVTKINFIRGNPSQTHALAIERNEI